jgi:hypothetical protein
MPSGLHRAEAFHHPALYHLLLAIADIFNLNRSLKSLKFPMLPDFSQRAGWAACGRHLVGG